MSPPLDLESLRRQYPDMPGWGERVFLELEAVKAGIESLKLAIKAKSDWTAKDISIVMGSMVAVIAALKGTGVA